MIVPLMFAGLLKPHTLVLIALAAVIAVYLYVLEKRTKSDTAAALCKKYAVMTEQLLSSVPDAELVRAVVANVMNKQDKRRPDVADQLPLLSRGRAAVYSVWLLCEETREQSLDVFFASPSRRFAEPAAHGFERIGALNCATALRTALRSYDEKAEKPLWDAVTTVFSEAIASENPLSLCVAYIRENPDEFVD